MKHNQHTKTNNFFIKQTKSDWLKSLGERRIKNKFNNIFFDPIYFQNNRKNITHNKDGEWAITHKIKIKNSLTANSEALKILNLGVNSITFINPDNSDLTLPTPADIPLISSTDAAKAPLSSCAPLLASLIAVTIVLKS